MCVCVCVCKGGGGGNHYKIIWGYATDLGRVFSNLGTLMGCKITYCCQIFAILVNLWISNSPIFVKNRI